MALAIPRSRPLTYDDVQVMADTGHRYELIGGTLLVTPAPNYDHQKCVLRVAVLMFAAAPPDLDVLVAPFDWYVSEHTFFEPDVLVARRSDIGPKRLDRPPLLAVEVLSPSTRNVDLVLKRAAYAGGGVESYWVVDPTEPSIRSLRLEGTEYVEEAIVAGDDTFTTDKPFPVTIVPGQLLS